MSAVQFAEDDFRAWAKEHFDSSAWARTDELQTLALIACEVRRHQVQMEKLFRSLDLSTTGDFLRYLPQTRGVEEIDGLDDVLSGPARSVLHAHHADLGEMLGTVRPQPITAEVRVPNASLYSDLA